MAQPVTVAEAKLFLRVEHEVEDGLIQTLIAAAQAKVEGGCRVEPDIDLAGAAEAGDPDAGAAGL